MTTTTRTIEEELAEAREQLRELSQATRDPLRVAGRLLHLLQEAQMGDDAYIVPCRLAGIIGGMISKITGQRSELDRLEAAEA